MYVDVDSVTFCLTRDTVLEEDAGISRSACKLPFVFSMVTKDDSPVRQGWEKLFGCGGKIICRLIFDAPNLEIGTVDVYLMGKCSGEYSAHHCGSGAAKLPSDGSEGVNFAGKFTMRPFREGSSRH